MKKVEVIAVGSKYLTKTDGGQRVMFTIKSLEHGNWVDGWSTWVVIERILLEQPETAVEYRMPIGNLTSQITDDWVEIEVGKG